MFQNGFDGFFLCFLMFFLMFFDGFLMFVGSFFDVFGMVSPCQDVFFWFDVSIAHFLFLFVLGRPLLCSDVPISWFVG